MDNLLINPSQIEAALTRARQALLAARESNGHWTGQLSSSALSTATAVCALAIFRSATNQDQPHLDALIQGGLDWLNRSANPDGGWGDTIRSFSNLSTTALVWAAFGAVPGADERFHDSVQAAQQWLVRHTGSLDPDSLADAIIARYGKDRTFSVPILTMCALAGRLGAGRTAWKRVIPLPFELAACPQRWFATLRLPVVSYALPALIAIGQARHHHAPSANPLIRWIRKRTRPRTLQVLTEIQPANGGFLEATPLTSFVGLSLAGSGQADHPVTIRAVQFLRDSVLPDGSWPIDTNLATWLTTLSVNALGPDLQSSLSPTEREQLLDWLLNQQYRTVHPFTNAPPGGWAWTDLPGGVPDADDTAGAVLTLHRLDPETRQTRDAAVRGMIWLLNLQNKDGGIPTFCRGWGTLPFDRSAPDLTAHAIRAWLAWIPHLERSLNDRIEAAIHRALVYLERAQRRDGSWVPLWFGNQHLPDEENPTYGTARVLTALADLLSHRKTPDASAMAVRGAGWLVNCQGNDGGWGGAPAGPASVEETALAVESLAHLRRVLRQTPLDLPLHLDASLSRGIDWLTDRVRRGHWTEPSPIGFYFAKLWYFERLYPLIFTVGSFTAHAQVDYLNGPLTTIGHR